LSDPELPSDAVEVGRILGPFGIKGWFKLQPFSADPQALFSTKRWYLKAATPRPGAKRPIAASADALALPPLLKITHAKEHGDGIVASAQEVPDRAAAEALKGASVWVSRASFPTPEPDEYYLVDLLGMQVFNRQGLALGAVVDFIPTGPHTVIVCEQPASAPGVKPAQTLIPFVAAYVDSVSVADRRIVCDWGNWDDTSAEDEPRNAR
jgi:16S rRNA processing protein RimM